MSNNLLLLCLMLSIGLSSAACSKSAQTTQDSASPQGSLDAMAESGAERELARQAGMGPTDGSAAQEDSQCTVLGKQVLELSAERSEQAQLIAFIGLIGTDEDTYGSQLAKYKACAESITSQAKRTIENRYPDFETLAASRGVTLAKDRENRARLSTEEATTLSALLVEENASHQEIWTNAISSVATQCGKDPGDSVWVFEYKRGAIVKAEVPHGFRPGESPSADRSELYSTVPHVNWAIEKGDSSVEDINYSAIIRNGLDARYFEAKFREKATLAKPLGGEQGGAPQIDNRTNQNQLACRLTFVNQKGQVVKGIGLRTGSQLQWNPE